MFAKDEGPEGGFGSFESSVVWSNRQDVRIGTRSSVEFTYSDVGGDARYPGEGNIFAAPRFVDADAGDLALAADSPCIGSGRDGSDMGALGARIGPERVVFLRGDTDLTGRVDLNDAIVTLIHLFRQGPAPSCLDRADANDDGGVNLTDPVHTLLFLFQQGAPIAPPYPEPGIDPTADDLACQ